MQHITQKIFEEISKIDIRLKPKEYSYDVLNIICDNLGYHFGSILLVDENGIGSIFSAYNLPGDYPELVGKVSAPVLSSPSGTAIRTGEIVVVNDIMSDSRLEPWHGLLKKFSIKTIVWIPLFSKGKAFGTYILYDYGKRRVSKKEKHVLGQLSMLFSLAIISSEYIDEIREKTQALENEILERKQVEKDLRVAKEYAEAANQAKDQFLSMMSHELRTPMNAVIGFADLLRKEEKDTERLDFLNIIHEYGESLLNLITGILDFVDIDSRHIELSKANFLIDHLLDEVFRRFIEKAESKHLFFDVIKEPTLPSRVLGDEHRISLVISNIVDNSIKFTEKGSVRVKCNYDIHNQTAIFTVSDTGPGIPEEKQEEIYQVFKQVDMSSNRKHGGVGLGLAIARKLVETMGGNISFESTPGTGSVFTIELPLPEAEE